MVTGRAHVQPLLACTTWGILWSVARRLNVFLITWVLGCRTITLMSHFKNLRASSIWGPTAAYTGILLLQGLVPVRQGYELDGVIGVCDWTHNSAAGPREQRVVLCGLNMLEFVGPSLATVAMISSAIVFIKSGESSQAL